MGKAGEIVGIGCAIAKLTSCKKGEKDEKDEKGKEKMHPSAAALHRLLDSDYGGVNPTADGYNGDTQDVVGQIAGLTIAVEHLRDASMKYPNVVAELENLVALLPPDEQAARKAARTAKPVAGDKGHGVGREGKPGAAAKPKSTAKRSGLSPVGG